MRLRDLKTGRFIENKVSKECLFCKKEFKIKQYLFNKRKFCSASCYYKYPKKGFKHTEENKRKISLIMKRIAKTGEEHPNWKGGLCKKNNERNDSAYQQWVRKIKNRDNWKCKINNKDCSGYCEVHHILSWSKYPELRYNINNGITLCQAHHPKKRAEEKRLAPVFQELVSVSNREI